MNENIKEELINKIRDTRDNKQSMLLAEKKYHEGYSAGYEQGIWDSIALIQKIEVQAHDTTN